MTSRSIPWQGLAIIHACAANADWGQLLLLTVDGGLHGVNLDSGQTCALAQLELPEPKPCNPYWHRGFAVHVAVSGDFAAVVDDGGSFGMLVNLRGGKLQATLHGGDYHPDTVPFSIAFTQHQGRDVLIHRTDWCQLDVMDCASGANLTQRDELGHKQEHDLDYFHGGLQLSPSGAQILDDGWVWAPVAIPVVWSVQAWLNGNLWESEDGPTRKALAQGEDWSVATTWLDEDHVAIWNIANWDDEGFGDCGHAPGVTVFDIHAPKPEEGVGGRMWPMPGLPQARHLHCMGSTLVVVGEGQSWLWNVNTRELLAHWSDFAPQCLQRQRGELLQWSAQEIWLNSSLLDL